MAAPDLFKGFEGSVATDSLGGTTIGKVSEFSLSINNNLEGYYAVGARGVNTLKEGNQEITGSITLAMVDKDQLMTVASPASAALQSDDDLYVQLDDGTNTTVDITLNDLKWGNFEMSFDNTGGTVMQTGSFIVKTIVIAAT